jgi:hypothetical protein
MDAKTLSVDANTQLFRDGHLRLASILSADVLGRIEAAAARLRERYPNGFDHGKGFGAPSMYPRQAYPAPTDRAPTVIYHNAGFLEPDLLLPLHDDLIYNTIASVVGRDFYLSNVWMQIVPPGTGRMGYHKDEHGSISITLPLDSIGWNSGSTCLVPGSHVHTPPPNLCMSDIMMQHKREQQLCGAPGDVIFFTPETWHGRAANLGSAPTCRLFFNFYSRSSRENTRWSPSIAPEVAAEVAGLFPAERRHMFRLGAVRPKAFPQSGFERWVKADGSSSADTTLNGVIREYFYWRYAAREPLARDIEGTILPPYRTAVGGNSVFSTREYLGHLNMVQFGRHLARTSINFLRSLGGTPGTTATTGE